MFDMLGFNYYSLFVAVHGITSVLSYVFFFLRIVFFYRKGIAYESKNQSLPKFKDIHLVFFGAGIFVPIVLSVIPYVSTLVFIASIVIFLKTHKEILSLKNLNKTTPEKISIYGAGMGLSGLIGFVGGYFRSKSYKELDEVVDEIVNEAEL